MAKSKNSSQHNQSKKGMLFFEFNAAKRAGG
jgi:hypothetical protein